MTELKVIEGRQSHLYNHFAEYELTSCRATKTRLMGVVAIKLSWQDASDVRRRFYQIIHLDYSEYGIDEYLEYDCVPESEDYKDTRYEMQTVWNHFISVMGGQAVSITPQCMLRLLEDALPIAGESIEREYDTEENISFRKAAVTRLDMMRDVLLSRGISSADCLDTDAMDAVSASNLGQYASINYFLMRLLDRDFTAAEFLSEIPRAELEKSPLASHGVQALMKASISKVATRDNPRRADKLRMYNCRVTSLAAAGYYHTTLSIWLDGGRSSRDALVEDMDFGSETLLTDYEAAVQLNEGEYLTVFDCGTDMPEHFDPAYVSSLSRAEYSLCENGVLYTIYNETNEHVEKAEYRLGDDVYGYALLSTRSELVLMSRDLASITMMDDEMSMSVYSGQITIKGRYYMESPLFHTLCHTPGLAAEDLLKPAD